jgi:hypothetical protein
MGGYGLNAGIMAWVTVLLAAAESIFRPTSMTLKQAKKIK